MAKVTTKNGRVSYQLNDHERKIWNDTVRNRYSASDNDALRSETERLGNEISTALSTDFQDADTRMGTQQKINQYQNNLRRLGARGFDVGNALTTANGYRQAFGRQTYINNNFASQDEYDAAMQYSDDLANLDLDAAQAEVDAWQQERANIANMSPEEITAYIEENKSWLPGYEEGVFYDFNHNILADYDSRITARQTYLNQIRNARQLSEMEQVIGENDFAANSAFTGNRSLGVGSEADRTYLYINDPEYREDYSISRNMSGGVSAFDPAEIESISMMTDDERSIFNYYYNTQGEDAAMEYLDKLTSTIRQRRAAERVDELEGRTGAELAFGVAAGLDQFGSGIRSILNTKDDYIAPSWRQYASGMVREDLQDARISRNSNAANSAGQVAYDTIVSGSNMLPSILASAAVGVLNPVAGQVTGAVLMGASASGNAYQEMLNLGYSKAQARGYSALVGASEAGLSYLLSGISKLGGAIPGGITEAVLRNVDNAFARVAIQLGTNAASEFTEEYLQEVLTPWFQNLALNAQNDVKLFTPEALYSGLLGALTAGVMEGGGTVSSAVQTRNTGRDFLGSTATLDDLKLLAELMPDNAEVQDLAARVNENSNAYTVGRFYEAVESGMPAQYRADVEASRSRVYNELVAASVTSRDANTIANAAASMMLGKKLSKAQTAALNQLRETLPGVDEAISNGVYSREMAVARIRGKVNTSVRGMANIKRSTVTATEAATTSEQQTSPATKTDVENGSQGDRKGTSSTVESLADEYDVTPSAIYRVAEKSSNQVDEKAFAEGMRTVLAFTQETTLSREEAITALQKNVTTLNAQQIAEAVILGWDLRNAVSAEKQRAYDMGFAGQDIGDVLDSKRLSHLTEAQRREAFNEGVKVAEEAVASGEKALPKTASVAYRKGSVRFDGDAKAISSKFKMTQRSAYIILERIAQLTGIDIVLFASKTDAQGNFIGEQGKFNSANPKEIRIDVNAGLNNVNDMGSLANYVMLRTFTHEFVHSLEVNAKAEYRALKVAVFAEIRRNGKENVENLILIEQEKGGKNEDGSYKMSYDDASHEVLAQSLVDVLPQSTFIETIATKHRNIFEKLYAALKRFMRTIRHRFEQMTSAIPAEAAALKRDVDGAMQYAQHIVDLFDKAALAAVETVQSKGTEAAQTNEATDQQKNENPTGKVRYQLRANTERTAPTEYAPVFYSKMAKVIEGMKQEKFGASSVVNMFRGKGVTSEEIKWSGVEAWLEGKKSVTKAELLEFIAGSALQIDEEVLTDEQTPYSEEQQRTLNSYNVQRESAVNELAEAWREQFGEELPTRHEYYDFVRSRIEKANEENAKASEEYQRYKDAERALRKVVDDNDYFGFDSLSEAMEVIRSDDGTFADYYEMSAEESEAFTRYFADREAYWNVPAVVSNEERRSLYRLAESVDEIGRDIESFKREHEEENKHRKTKWGEYKIPGGANYREVLFKIPNSTYWNDSTLMHWENRLGVFAHARVQDLNTAEGTMLLVEEIQSDWHNEGRKKGYETDLTSAAMIEERETLYKRQEDIRKELRTANAERITEKQQRLKNSLDAVDQQIAELTRKIKEFVPDAPFRENYQEYVLKRLIREAAEKGYDSIGWTTADIQSRRWDSKYAEGYRIEYDQDIPKFLNKYGKKWGTKVERTSLDNGTEIWTMTVTESMKDSVLYEGQSRFQRRENLTDRAVLERVDEIVGAVSDSGTVTGDTHGLEVDEVAAFKGKLTEGERDLLAIYADRLAKLNDLQEQRREQGRLYRRFMADENPANRDKAAAVATKNRMDILDQQIEKAMNSLREVERAKGYKSLLTKSRELVEQTERGRILTALQLSREKRERSGQRRQRKESIIRAAEELESLLNKGNKKRNVKKDMQGLAAGAADLYNVLFNEEMNSPKYSKLFNERIVRNGFGVILSTKEATHAEEAKNILAKMERGRTQELENQLAYRMGQLHDALERERERINGINAGDVFQRIADEYKNLQNSGYDYIRGAFSEDSYNHLLQLKDKVGTTAARDMTLSQLIDLDNAYRVVLTTIRNANKLFIDGQKQTVQQAGNRVIVEVARNARKNKSLTSLGNFIATFTWNNEKPIYAFERIGSNTLTNLFWNIRNGEDVWIVDVEEAKAYRQAQAKKYGYDSWDAEKRYEFKSTDGATFSLTLEQLMSLYAYSKREQAIDHLLKGGVVLAGAEVIVNGKRLVNDDATAYAIPADTLAKIGESLTAEQRGYVDAMQDYLSREMARKGNEISMQLYGIELFGEKNYFPINSSGIYNEKAEQQFRQKENGQISIVNSGFTKSTAPKASNPVRLSGFSDVWASHVNEMSMYHAFVLPLEDFRRVLNFQTTTENGTKGEGVVAAIQNAQGSAAVKYINQLQEDLNGGAVSDYREAGFKRMTSKFKKAATMASLSVVVQQISSLPRAWTVIDPKYFSGKVNKQKYSATLAEMRKYAPVMMIKEMGHFDTGMGRSATEYINAREYTGKERFGAFFKDSGYRDEILGKAPAKVDEIAWMIIWEACKNETHAKNPNMSVTSEAFLKAAGERFTEVIVKTQVYDSTLTKSANMRSKSALMGMVTSFLAEPTVTANMFFNALRSKDSKVIGRTAGTLLVSAIANNFLASLVYAMRDDDEDETYWEKYLQSFATGMLEDLNQLTWLPFLRDVWSILQGFDVQRADMNLISSVVDSLKSFVRTAASWSDDMTDEEKKEYWNEFGMSSLNIALTVANMFGIPLKNVAREVSAVYNTFEMVNDNVHGNARKMGEKIWDDVRRSTPILGWFPKANSKTDRLYDAIISGDTGYQERAQLTYASEKSYENAVRKALRENDIRIEAAAKARMSGNLTEYVRLFREIENEGHFEFDTIMAAVNAAENALTPDEESAASESTQTIFTIGNYYTALAAGDETSAQLAYEELYQQKIAEGYLASEARSSVENSLATQIGQAYRDGEIGREQALRLLQENTEEHGEYDIAKWDFQMKYGFSWGSREREYRIGNISRDALIQEYMSIEGETRADAIEYVDELDFENREGYDYSEIGDEYAAGNINRQQAASRFIEAGFTAEEAEENLVVIDFVEDFPGTDGISYKAATNYRTYCEPVGIGGKAFFDSWKIFNETETSRDENGDAIEGQKKKDKVLAYIDSLPYSAAQKDSLYLAFGYSEKNIDDAPWH